MAFEISPDVGLRFGDLTLEEFDQIRDGHDKRERTAWNRVAWMVTYILRSWGNKNITPEKLLGRPMSRRGTPPPPPEDDE